MYRLYIFNQKQIKCLSEAPVICIIDDNELKQTKPASKIFVADVQATTRFAGQGTWLKW